MPGTATSAEGLAGTPADQHTIRDHNLAIVLHHVFREGQSSRARIAAETGLNKTTVSSLVAELIERRLLRDGELQHSGTVGRPAVAVELDGDVYVAIGMEVNVEYIAWAVVDLRSRMRDHEIIAVDNRTRDPREVLTDLAGRVIAILPDLDEHGLVPIAANLALPGLIDAARSSVLVAPNLGWEDVPAGAILQDLFAAHGLPVLVDNEANLAALAEHRIGAGQGLDSFIHVSGEVGVGAGVIVDGRLYRGALGFGGELGHLTLNPDGPLCSCGARGCLETYVGLPAMLRRAGLDPDEVLATAATNGVAPADQLLAAAQSGDADILAALDETGHMLGIALASAVNLLSPQAIVLGGIFTNLHPWLAPGIEEELAQRVLAARLRAIRVIPSDLQLAAAVRGAAALALTQVLGNPATAA